MDLQEPIQVSCGIHLNSTFSDLTLVAWNQPWWEYLHLRNQQIPQIRAFSPLESLLLNLLAHTDNILWLCGILALNQGSEHSSPALHCRFLTARPPGKSPYGRLSKYSTCELCIIIFIACKYSRSHATAEARRLTVPSRYFVCNQVCIGDLEHSLWVRTTALFMGTVGTFFKFLIFKVFGHATWHVGS